MGNTTEIKKVKIFDKFELKGRGTIFCFDLSSNGFPADATKYYFKDMIIEVDFLKYKIKEAEKFRPSIIIPDQPISFGAIVEEIK